MEKERLHPVFHRMPGDWRIVRVDQAFSIQQGKQVSARNRDGQRQRPFLRTKNVYWGRLDLAELDEMHFSEEDEKRLQLLPGDLLTCEGGWVGRTAMWNGEAANCLFQNHLHRLRRVSAETNSQFALYWLWYAFEIGNVYFGRQNVTTIPNLSKSRLGELPMPLPKPNEQRQIAAVLSAVQRAIERQERLIALTAELKKALMHKLFTEGTRGEELKGSEVGSIPQSWQAVRLADAVEYIDYGISAAIPKTAPANGVKIVSTADITKDGRVLYHKVRRLVAPERTVQRLTLKQGDVLFNWRNSAELIGKSAVFDEQEEPHVFASFILRIRCDEKRAHNFFLAYLMNYFREQGVFVKLSRRAVNQANYNRNEISVLPIPLPPFDEQLVIASAIASVDSAGRLHERRRDCLNELFRNLLHQLMTAQIRVCDLDLSALDETLSEPEQAAGQEVQLGNAARRVG